MKKPIIDRGKNMTFLQDNLLLKMDAQDSSQLVAKIVELIEQLPNPQGTEPNKQGLLLGLIQSGKTNAFITAIALAADNGYKCFIVLTSDNLWLYNQTIDERLKIDLPGLQVEGKEDWERKVSFMADTLNSPQDALILVATKNAKKLNSLSNLLDRLKTLCNGQLPTTLIIDDEADQASLDTQASRRSKTSSIAPGTINNLITQIRGQFPRSTYLQVTATPQALFLQDPKNWYRPEFTILTEPGKGYVGGETFFSLISGQSQNIIRRIVQQELDTLIANTTTQYVPDSLKSAICTFYVGATIKYLQNSKTLPSTDLVYSFLCHISQKKVDHDTAFEAISIYFKFLREGLSISATPNHRFSVENELQAAYNDLVGTLSTTPPIPTFQKVVTELQGFIVGTAIQVLNSDREQSQPQYSRYNILIGGTKLSRGVTIKNLLVTYYGRQAKNTNMDTMLQHARMYGYRQNQLDVTRLYVTQDVEDRFRLIYESEEAMRELVRDYPETFRGIKIGRNLNPTRRNVLNPNNIGAYVAGREYFPRKPFYLSSQVTHYTQQLDKILDTVYPQNSGTASIQITIDKAIEILKLTHSDPTGSSLWDDQKIIAALETLKNEPKYNNTALLIVRRNRSLNYRQGGNELGNMLSPNDRLLTRGNSYPTLVMYRLDGAKPQWDGVPFWLPGLTFPVGNDAFVFNFD